MSPLDYHVLLALSSAPLHGYAIKKLVADESGGTQMPRAGTLYRVIARLVTSGLVREAAAADREPHPGLERRYCAHTGGTSSAGGRGAAAQADCRNRGAPAASGNGAFVIAAVLRLVALLPRGFRRQFGDDLTAHIRADYADARGRGRVAALSSSTFHSRDRSRCSGCSNRPGT